jgi:uncharacterized protein (DUF58 family)
MVRVLHIDIPEVWVRFLLAIVGLALAFAAALFSTVSRESGNLWATLVLSSAALMLAVVVGLTTVPYLAKRVVAARVRDAFDFEVTRVGIAYVLAVLVISAAALNTGNNLLYIVVAAMLAAILVSGVASALVLRGLELEVRLPEHVFAGRMVAGRVVPRNTKQWLPSFSVNFISFDKPKPKKSWQWKRTTFELPPGKPREQQWFHLPDLTLRRVDADAGSPPIFEGTAYFPFIPAASEVSADLQLRFERRGRYAQESFGLSTRFPFAFLTKTRRVAMKKEILVYPPVTPPDELFAVLPMITGEFESLLAGRGYDLYRIREAMPEDSARHVDWKATAKSGSLKVREFTREDEKKLRIIFDNVAVEGLTPEAYERAITTVASLGWHFSQESTQLSFLAPGYEGSPDIYDFLEHLALASPQALPSIVNSLKPSDDYNLVVTTRPRGYIPTALWSCSYFVFSR